MKKLLVQRPNINNLKVSNLFQMFRKICKSNNNFQITSCQMDYNKQDSQAPLFPQKEYLKRF